MNPPQLPRRRRIWPWVLAAILAPWLFLAAVVWSFVTPTRLISAVHDEVASASRRQWHTRVQLDVGGGTLACIRTGMALVRGNPDVVKARAALAAVKHASVGVYFTPDAAEGSTTDVMAGVDRDMARRGWTRIVGVVDGRQTVRMYAPDDAAMLRQICVAVLDGEQFVVVQAEIDADALARLVHELKREGKLDLPRIAGN